MASDQELNLDCDLTVTREDVEALRRLRAEVPSWLLLDWRDLHALIQDRGASRRSLANDNWRPFSLE